MQTISKVTPPEGSVGLPFYTLNLPIPNGLNGFNFIYTNFHQVVPVRNVEPLITLNNDDYVLLNENIQKIITDGKIICKTDQATRMTCTCCGFISPVIAFFLYMQLNNPNKLNYYEIINNAVVFFTRIAYDDSPDSLSFNWNRCHGQFYEINHVNLGIRIPINNSVYIFTMFLVRFNAKVCTQVDTFHHFTVVFRTFDFQIDTIPAGEIVAVIFDAWASNTSARPLWIRTMRLADFTELLRRIDDTNNITMLNTLVENYFVPPHRNIDEKTIEKKIYCRGFCLNTFIPQFYVDLTQHPSGSPMELEYEKTAPVLNGGGGKKKLTRRNKTIPKKKRVYIKKHKTYKKHTKNISRNTKTRQS